MRLFFVGACLKIIPEHQEFQQLRSLKIEALALSQSWSLPCKLPLFWPPHAFFMRHKDPGSCLLLPAPISRKSCFPTHNCLRTLPRCFSSCGSEPPTRTGAQPFTFSSSFGVFQLVRVEFRWNAVFNFAYLLRLFRHFCRTTGHSAFK